MFKLMQVEYDFLSVLQADYLNHGESCIQYSHKQMGNAIANIKLPETYISANTTIYQRWWDKTQLDYKELGRQLHMEVISISSIMQLPGNCVPYHRDTFYKISLKYPDRTDLKVRVNIFLEDSALGHLMQFTRGNNHETISAWKANTGYMFDSSILHLSVNAGMTPKYTLQVSGFYLGQEQ